MAPANHDRWKRASHMRALRDALMCNLWLYVHVALCSHSCGISDIGYMRMLHCACTHAVFLVRCFLFCSLANGHAICHWERAVIGYMRMLHCACTHAVFLTLVICACCIVLALMRYFWCVGALQLDIFACCIVLALMRYF